MRLRISIFCILSLLAVSVRAQQSVISYQGEIANASGAPADSGTYSVTVSFYSDAAGENPVWQDTFETMVRKGIFNIALGSGRQLPSPSDLDRPIWVGTRIGAMSESRPLTRLSSVPMAMNVADSSITSSKLNADYISSISVNGRKVTGKASSLNIVGNVEYDDASKSLLVNAGGAIADSSGKGASAENAATGDWTVGGDDLSVLWPKSVLPVLGTLNTSGPEPIDWWTIVGDERATYYHYVPGGTPDIAGGDASNLANNNVLGGDFIGGGAKDTIHGALAAIGGGANNTIDTLSDFSVIAGGDSNHVDGSYGAIGGGYGNVAANSGTIAGGMGNGAGIGGAIGGGGPNLAGEESVVAGGEFNIADVEYAAIGGGEYNETHASVSYPLTYPGAWSAISGGIGNYIYGTASAIPGGEGMRIGSYSFGFNGDSTFWPGSLTTYTDLTAVTGIAYFGNVNLMIGNVDSVARQLRFYGPNTDHAYGSGAKFTSFQAPVMDSDVFYTLPKAQGDTNTVLTEDGRGNLKWTNQLGASGWSITGNFGTSPPTNFIGTLDSEAFEIHLFDTATSNSSNKRVMRYELGVTSPNIVGGSRYNAIDTGLSGAAILSGGSNGTPNIDSGSFSVIAGGSANRINSGAQYSHIGGGNDNSVGSYNSTISGGYNNAIGKYSDYAAIGGGINNTINDTAPRYIPSQAVISGGSNNTIESCIATIAGGIGNTVYSDFASIGGGNYGTIYTNSLFGSIAGGDANTIGPNSNHASIAGGGPNTVNSPYSAVGGGQDNTIDTASDHATIAGGSSNTITSGGSYSGIFSGKNNTVQDSFSVIAGGDSNKIGTNASYSGIFSGKNNIVQDSFSVIAGGDSNKIAANASYSSILGGQYNIVLNGAGSSVVSGHYDTVSGGDSFTGAGYGNAVLASEGFIGAGEANTEDATQSGIASGFGNTIDSSGRWSLIGAGLDNIITKYGGTDFIGAGSTNSISDVNAAIIAGEYNAIDAGAEGSLVGAGYHDTALAFRSFIGAGFFNVTDSGGKYAAIPGGEGLHTQSYAQTAMGFYNMRAGTTKDPFSAHSTAHGDDPLVIVGRGLPDTLISGIAHSRDSDAATISNNGHISAFQNIGSGVSTPTRVGTMYESNTIEAYGNVVGGDSVAFDDIGVLGVYHDSAGSYTIVLNIKNPNGSSHTFTAGHGAITASIGLNSDNAPGFIAVSPLLSTGDHGIFSTQPGFTVATFNTSGTTRSDGYGFQFHVVAR